MTHDVNAVIRKLVEKHLAEIRAEAEVLEAWLRDLDGAAPEPRAANGVRFGNGTFAGVPAAEATDPPQAPGPSPLSLRLEQLQEQHGPVYVIEPRVPVDRGQRIQYGAAGAEKQVEILEPVTQPDQGGQVKAGRWFAKVLAEV